MLEPEIEITCPYCQSNEVVVVDFIAAFNAPLPDIYALDCQRCGRTGSGYQDSGGWKIDWDEIVETSK
jgi:hypothetical protein